MNDIHTHQLGPVSAFSQGLLELLWTVYSEGRLQSFLRLRNFQNPFNKDKSLGTKKGLKFAPVVERVSEAKFYFNITVTSGQTLDFITDP